MPESRLSIMPMRTVAIALLFWPVVIFGGQKGFFFDAPPPQRNRAAFSHAEREQLLVDAYACNRATASKEQHERCLSRERAAQQVIDDRTQSNHRLFEPARQELRRFHEKNSIR